MRTGEHDYVLPKKLPYAAYTDRVIFHPTKWTLSRVANPIAKDDTPRLSIIDRYRVVSRNTVRNARDVYGN